MKKLALTAASAAILGMTTSAVQAAGDSTSPMTNIVELEAACDIAAIGIDFGKRSSSLGAAVTSVVANSGTGTNPDHPSRDEDGAADPTDDLSFSIAGQALDLGAAITALPGVFVACSDGAPASVTVASTSGGTDAALIAGSTPATGTVDFTSQMIGEGGGAVATDVVDYSISFLSATPAAVTIPAELQALGVAAPYIGVFQGTGTIPTTQTGTHPTGFYHDVVTVTLVQ